MDPDETSKKYLEDILFYISIKNPELSIGNYQNHKLEESGLGYWVITSEGNLIVPWAAIRDYDSRDYIEEYTDYMVMTFRPNH